MNYDIAPSREIEADIRLARYSMSPEGNPTNDEAMYNQAAYHAQQAIEKGLKFYLRDVYGEDEKDRKFRIHDIDTLCARLKDRYHHLVDEEIVARADEITDWEANSRYRHSLVSARADIETVLAAGERILADIKRIEESQNAKGNG